MAILRTTLVVILLAATGAFAYSTSDGPQYTLDSNVALYEGEALTYVVYPPDDFRMEVAAATDIGYSFAFVPKAEAFDTADLQIGVNIYRIRGMRFEDVVVKDTASLREHYGKQVEFAPLDSVFSSNGQEFVTFFIRDDSGFIPNAMIAYFDGGNELLIFELVVTGRVVRFKAEQAFLQCLRRLKVLSIGDLGYE